MIIDKSKGLPYYSIFYKLFILILSHVSMFFNQTNLVFWLPILNMFNESRLNSIADRNIRPF